MLSWPMLIVAGLVLAPLPLTRWRPPAVIASDRRDAPLRSLRDFGTSGATALVQVPVSVWRSGSSSADRALTGSRSPGRDGDTTRSEPTGGDTREAQVCT
ncbi:MAG: hypothetical protein KIT69_01675 [Propionibacteriaceae bacterium]|nr:hypothetical protein [Propionibacteriaceae bacterium]